MQEVTKTAVTFPSKSQDVLTELPRKVAFFGIRAGQT
jgi:hypothetical protein